ncbi:uncharacterized protein LOC106181203 isoform X1 [Lingula anatina]|uniref:Uncharacterized protein LOC106181203 isoform X1 n=1 Tax=Lingula anatina TaxID=7574 RepID=A0A1S3KEU9_LINAN|nr:uncharacterized protein LOC106181203 isoform X1 [Lingula anatina]XP_013420979.1 uncharacterized protein LOC106181203 isoform X1 [Lingula anatina]|eukprot:XP_013420977.1 uncharacterized protein LOC106181203 isoform X1 [Lingula anatina]
MAVNKLKVIMFLGTVRENRIGERVGIFMKKILEETDHEVEVMDPKEIDFPLLKKAFHHYDDPSDAPQFLQDCNAKIQEADAFVVVSAEYNHSIPPALSNMMDHFSPSVYAYKPSGIVSYSPGQTAGVRAAIQLRSFLGVLGCMSVPSIFGIPQVHEAIDADGEPLNKRMREGALEMVQELDWHAHAMRNHRMKVGVPTQ